MLKLILIMLVFSILFVIILFGTSVSEKFESLQSKDYKKISKVLIKISCASWSMNEAAVVDAVVLRC